MFAPLVAGGKSVSRFPFPILLVALMWAPPTLRAHSPHDHIEAFDLGPSRENPGTEVMLIVVRGNLWRSTDYGESWKRIVRGLDTRWELKSVVVAPAPEGSVWYLGTDGDGVYRSIDDGWSWQKMNEGLVETKVRAMAASGERVIVATTDGRVYMATPAETAWRMVHEHPEKVSTVGVDHDGRLVLGDETGRFFRSGDGGAGWVEFLHRPDPAGATAYLQPESGEALIGFGTAGIFQKGPKEYHEFNRGLTDRRITYFASTSRTLFAVTWNDGVFRSVNQGASWQRRAEGLTTDKQGDRRGLPQFTVLRVAADGALFLAGYDGLFRSGDEGGSWTQLVTLPQTLLIDFDVSPDFANDLSVAAITYWKGAALSRDGGLNWTPINGGLAPGFWDQAKRKRQGTDDYGQIQRFHSIAFSPDYERDHTIFAGLRNWFISTDDGGESWEQTELTRFAEGEDLIPDRPRFSPDFANDSTILFCGRFGEGKTRAGAVFRSTDRGKTWQEVLRTEGKYMQSLALSPDFAEDGTAFTSSARGGNNSEVFRTTDGGLTWEIVTGDLTFTEYGAELAFSPDFSQDRTVWAGTETGLWRSTDAGDSWQRLKTGAFSENAFADMIAVSSGRMIVTAKGEGMFESTDGGRSFRPFRENDFRENHQINRLWSYSPGKLLKFAKNGAGETEILAFTGEHFFRYPPDGSRVELPVRESVAHVGEVDLRHWRGAVISLCVAGLGAVGVIVSAILRWRRVRARKRGV